MTARRYRRRADVLERNLGEDLVLLLPTDEASVLASGSAAVWRALGTTFSTPGDICDRLSGRADDPVDRALVEAALEGLARLHAVEGR